MNYADFVSKRKSLVIAPAGYGKTYSIAECLKYTHGKQLILTHTHAGVASLKEKIQKQGVEHSCYKIETITSIAQKYVNAFYCGNDIPEQDNTNEYYPFIIKKAKILFKIKPIQHVIKATYTGLFVDEYQDCTLAQHELLTVLSDILPIHIFGDPLQGIFGFQGQELVDFNRDLTSFERVPDLSEPWRWKNINSDLGDCLKCVRAKLEKRESIDLSLYESHIEILQTAENDKYTYNSDYNKKIWELTNENGVLIIHPDSASVNVRKAFISRFNNAFLLVEAIDSNDFYEFSHKFEFINTGNVYSVLYELIPILFNGTTSRDEWFNANGLKNKRNQSDKKLIKPIKENIESLRQLVSLSLISKTLKEIKKLPRIKCYRKELFSDLCKALTQAEYKGVSVYAAMKEIRNIKRRVGRKVQGKCIGTTLLTKGLEFDIVAVLDAHKFECPKNFYVAITRACRRLIIFTESKQLSLD